jgi:choline dehydrogenase-like flavoprotein
MRRALGALTRSGDARRRRSHVVLGDITPMPGAPFEAVSATPISRHVMGTARMGDDPATSVFDLAASARRRLRAVHRLVGVPDGRGYGPTLTLVALAIRACRALADVETPPANQTATGSLASGLPSDCAAKGRGSRTRGGGSRRSRTIPTTRNSFSM